MIPFNKFSSQFEWQRLRFSELTPFTFKRHLNQFLRDYLAFYGRIKMRKKKLLFSFDVAEENGVFNWLVHFTFFL